MGKGIELIHADGVNIQELFNNMKAQGLVLCEEIVHQSEHMARIHPTSVNTVRVMTFKTKEGVEVPFCFMRTGQNGSFVDNGGSGGLLLGVNIATGIVNTDAFDEYGQAFEVHPNTNITFKGFQIPDWDKMINICKSEAEKETRLNYLSWDMAHTDKGWCVIEVNEVGQLIVPQIVYKNGIRDTINLYMDKMEQFI